MRSLTVLVLAAVAASLLAPPARAADASAAILGIVRTDAGTPVGDARVALTSPSARYATRSDARGHFTVAAVDPDVYAVEVTKDGFATWRLAGVVANPGTTVRLTVTLAPQLQTIGSTAATIPRAFNAGAPQDTFTVSGTEARGPLGAASSGLAEYTRGTVQSVVARVPGVQQDAFANVVIRGGKVDDTVFGYDGVPVPQAIIAEPGGNVIGAQLPTTGLGFTRVTTGGFSTGADDALGGIVDEIPQIGVYPARTTLTTGLGLLAPGRNVEINRLWATPSLRQRYAIDAQIGSQAIRYGDGTSFYPAEAATYGLALADRATWSVAGNAHLRSGARDDVETLALAGEATYDQYGTPFGGQTYGAFDGAQTAFPGEPSSGAPVLTPTRIRGTYAIEKIEDLRTYDQSYARLRLYRSQYGAQTNAPFFDDLSFPNGVISYAGRQSGVLTGFGFDVKTFAAERHRTAYGIEL
ncbi:MAG TPA: carboxypeptidase-like regulatory domain-containing protein, partial [Candidatus Elarobacter sp.]